MLIRLFKFGAVIILLVGALYLSRGILSVHMIHRVSQEQIDAIPGRDQQEHLIAKRRHQDAMVRWEKLKIGSLLAIDAALIIAITMIPASSFRSVLKLH